MSSEEYRFMLWIQTSETSWSLWSRNSRRELVEHKVRTIPIGAAWRLVGLYDGLLAESVNAANQDRYSRELFRSHTRGLTGALRTVFDDSWP